MILHDFSNSYHSNYLLMFNYKMANFVKTSEKLYSQTQIKKNHNQIVFLKDFMILVKLRVNLLI